MIDLPIANKTYEQLRDLTLRMYKHQGTLERKTGGFLLELIEAAENMNPGELRMIRSRRFSTQGNCLIDEARKLRAQLRVIPGGLYNGPKRVPREGIV